MITDSQNNQNKNKKEGSENSKGTYIIFHSQNVYSNSVPMYIINI